METRKKNLPNPLPKISLAAFPRSEYEEGTAIFDLMLVVVAGAAECKRERKNKEIVTNQECTTTTASPKTTKTWQQANNVIYM